MESAMPLNDNFLTAAAQGGANAATHATINGTYPDATGASAATARQPIAWTVANGDLSLSAAENFTGGPANGAAVSVGLWNADGSVYYGDVQIPNDGTNDLTFNAAGEYTLNTITVTGSAA